MSALDSCIVIKLAAPFYAWCSAIVNTVIVFDSTFTFIFATHFEWIIYGLPLNVQLINSKTHKTYNTQHKNADVNKSETEEK